MLFFPICLSAEILDQAKIHNDYNNGDFDRVEIDLESFKTRNKSFSHEDSVFIAKHLAVVYAANPQTREKGRYYMFRLLELLPSAKIVDMFVSEEIDRIFDKVKEEFQTKQYALGKGASNVSKLTDSNGTEKNSDSNHSSGKNFPKSKGSSSAIYWVAGGVGIVAIATGAYLLARDPKAPEDNVYVVQKNRTP